MKKRWSSLLFCAALLCAFGVTAAAEDLTVPETYLTWNGSELVPAKVPTPITEVTTDTTELNGNTTGGWYIVRGSVEISGRVTVSGDVHLILKEHGKLVIRVGVFKCGAFHFLCHICCLFCTR